MYRVLYRKWRPQVFADVIGQPQVTLTLSSQVRENRLSHAYLFTGTRGTGKTTCAKIFSKAVNCLNPVNGDPCNECEICRGIDNGTVLDIVEIDAASNRGIDDIRLLRDEANFTPSMAKYRVYIIDEVHMLTIEAFNALLKTLEEPPEHVKFILATTEVHKLPATILSRCQRFDFRRIEPSVIAERLMKIADAEKARLQKDAALLIARIADGGMRDALSLLDRCISVTDEVNVQTVAASAGLMGREYIYNLINAISRHDTAQCLIILDDLHNASCDTERLLSELTNQFRNFLIVKTVNAPENLIVCTADELENIKKLSSLFTDEQLMFALNVLSETSDAVKRTQNRRIEAELALIRLCSPETSESTAALNVRISALEKKLEAVTQGGFTIPAAASAAPQAPVVKEAEKTEISDINTAELPFSDDEAAENDARSQAVTVTPDDFAGFGAEAKNSAYQAQFDAASDEDDEEFDFDAFMNFYGTAQNDNEEKTAEAAADNFAEAAADNFAEAAADNAPTPIDGAQSDKLDDRTWVRIILETEKNFAPLIGVLTNSTAYIRGNSLCIKFANVNAKFLVREETLNRYVKVAVKNVLGKEYIIKTEN